MLVSLGAHFETFDLRFGKQGKPAAKAAKAVEPVAEEVVEEVVEEAPAKIDQADLLKQLAAILGK